MRELEAEIQGLIQPKFIVKSAESRIRLCGLIASEFRCKYSKLVIRIWQKWEESFICELRKGTGCSVNLASLIETIKVETLFSPEEGTRKPLHSQVSKIT